MDTRKLAIALIKKNTYSNLSAMSVQVELHRNNEKYYYLKSNIVTAASGKGSQNVQSYLGLECEKTFFNIATIR